MIKKYRLPIGYLFEFFNIENEYNIPIEIQRLLKIKTPTGYQKINYLIKKQGNIYEYSLEDNIKIRCDENHLVKNEEGNFIFIKECDIIQTIYGNKKILSNEFIKYGDVYDMSIDDPHEYITSNGVICHNTTLAKILVNNINCDYIYINASDENSVDNVRDKIKGFASSVAFRDIKIIILDEADFLTLNAQAALRNIMETFSKTTRFVLTCNYVERILDAISSRCQTFEVVPPSKGDVAKRLAVDILTKEGITYENTDIKLLIDSHYPDIRKIINTAQKHSIDGKLQIDKKEILESDFKLKIIDILKETKSKSQKFAEIRQIIADNGVSHFEDIYKLLYDNMTEYGKGKLASIIVLLAEMEYKSAFVVDKEINFMSAIVQLLEILYGGN